MIVEKKIEDAEEGVLLKQVTLELFKKFNSRYQEERTKIVAELTDSSKSISNLSDVCKSPLLFPLISTLYGVPAELLK